LHNNKFSRFVRLVTDGRTDTIPLTYTKPTSLVSRGNNNWRMAQCIEAQNHVEFWYCDGPKEDFFASLKIASLKTSSPRRRTALPETHLSEDYYNFEQGYHHKLEAWM